MPNSERRHWPRRLLIVLVVLALLAVGLDRGGDFVAERLAARNLQSSQHLSRRPDVSIDGVPFLTELAEGDYDHISVDADDLPVADGSVRISHLHVDLNQLHVSRDFETFHVTSATALATIDYTDLSHRLGVTVRYAGNGRIKASKTLDLPVIGKITPSISVLPTIANGALSFGKSTINGAGDSAALVSEALHKIFDVSIPFGGIPFEVKIRSLTAGANGLQGTFVGADLTYAKGT